MSEKLHKVLARAGYGSRRKMEITIKSGNVSIDGKLAKLGERVKIIPGLRIQINGHQISIKESTKQICRVLMYYKPEGELCTCNDPKGRPTVFDRLPKLYGRRWIIVGRMDINTCGLLLFTTDGELANNLMHPRNKVEREYAVRVFGRVSQNKLHYLRQGIQLVDGTASFKKIKFIGGKGINQWYSVTLVEGRNREVRRLWEAIGLQVSRLIRIRFGNILLPKGLSCGSYAELDFIQTTYLRKLVKLNLETNSNDRRVTNINRRKLDSI